MSMIEARHGDTVHARVAGEVRAWLGRRNISAREAASRLGWTQPYLSRRISGHVAFNVGDLDSLGELLHVDPAAFFASPDDEPAVRKGARNIIYSLLHPLGVAA